MTTLRFEAHGTPAPQGSKRHVGNGIMIESSKKVKPWREAVKWAALAQLPRPIVPLEGPLVLDATFTLARPKSAKRRLYPTVKPDLDKLLRSTMDALKDAGVYRDDAQVVSGRQCKTYPRTAAGMNYAPDALAVPGAVITIRHMEAE